MSSPFHRTPKSGGQPQSLFFRDLTTPVSSHRGKFASPSQAAAVSALWRENFDPPPPPVFTLEDRAEFSPEAGLGESLELKAEVGATRGPASASPLKGESEAGTSHSASRGGQSPRSAGSLSWWTPVKSGSPSTRSGGGEQSGNGNAPPAGGVVQTGALLMLPPPREVARPDIQRNALPAGDLDEETWVTVFGFPPGDTNFVLREFEKCGTILRHVVGPRDANWMHILYQNRFDAQKALSKNGTQINGVLIVGVKLLDPSQRQYLDDMSNRKSQGFLVMPPKPTGGGSGASPSPRPYYLQNTSDKSRPSVGAIASPAKSAVSKIMDLMFGV